MVTLFITVAIYVTFDGLVVYDLFGSELKLLLELPRPWKKNFWVVPKVCSFLFAPVHYILVLIKNLPILVFQDCLLVISSFRILTQNPFFLVFLGVTFVGSAPALFSLAGHSLKATSIIGESSKGGKVWGRLAAAISS